MLNTRQPPRFDDDKALVPHKATQEPQGVETETPDDNKATQERKPLPGEKTERSSGKDEDDKNEVDYQCVVWDGTFPVASVKLVNAFAEVSPARQRENANVFIKFLKGASVTFAYHY